MLQCAAENPQALMIMEATAMTQQTQCQLRADAPAQFIRPYGVLDLSLTNQYYLFPTVKNMMVELQTVIGEGPDSLITENHVLSIKAAEIRVDMGEFQPVSSDTNKVKQIATSTCLTVFVWSCQGPLNQDKLRLWACKLLDQSWVTYCKAKWKTWLRKVA